MREVSGYLTDDGKFFESMIEAELHEAEVELHVAAEAIGFRPTSMVKACQEIATQIVRYIDAHVATEHSARTQDRERVVEYTIADLEDEYARAKHPDDRAKLASQIAEYRQNNRSATRTTPSVLEQPLNSREPMPDLWRSFDPKTVRNDSPLDGVGSRSPDAPSVRSRPPMATGVQTRLAETLRRNREAHLRDPLGEDRQANEEDYEDDRRA